jgi:predicted Co/Zn/Cd cation transporter (cation efflux family)
MEDEIDFEKCADPLMIILNSLELIKLQYDGVMDDGIKTYLNRIDKSAQKIERLLQELKTKHKVYN